MENGKNEKEQLKAEREQLKRELVSKWDVWQLVTQNTIAGEYFNDLDEDELWEKLLAMEPEDPGWKNAEEEKPKPWKDVLCDVEYYSYRRDKKSRRYDIGYWSSDGFWCGSASLGKDVKILFWKEIKGQKHAKKR